MFDLETIVPAVDDLSEHAALNDHVGECYKIVAGVSRVIVEVLLSDCDT
jgi:hypothetical protein